MTEKQEIWFNNKVYTNQRLVFENLYKNQFLVVPGAHDPISALLAKKAGFKAIYLSGGALSSSLGFPDIGLMTMEDLINRTRQIVSISNLPLIVDDETEYEEVKNVIGLVNEIEAAGGALIQIEDQILLRNVVIEMEKINYKK